MVIGYVKVEKTIKVKNNPFYGKYEYKDTYTHHIVSEKYDELMSPEQGIHITLKTACDGDTLDIIVTKYAFEGELPKHYDKDTEFSTSFSFDGHIYEVTVDVRGELLSLDEWYSMGDCEDDNEPDGHWNRKSRGIKWELLEQ